jgi:hypothetical protein
MVSWRDLGWKDLTTLIAFPGNGTRAIYNGFTRVRGLWYFSDALDNVSNSIRVVVNDVVDKHNSLRLLVPGFFCQRLERLGTWVGG